MKLQIVILCAFAILQDVSAFPAKGHPYKSENCIKMTPQKEKEINTIITRITDFLGNITSEFEDFDIRLVKLDIESHSEDEVEEKDVQLQLTVNDCAEDTGDDEDDEQKSEEHDDTDDKQEKDISIEVPEEAKKDKPDDEQDISATNKQTTVESTTQANDFKGCEKCPCVCNLGNKNNESTTNIEQNNENKDDTDKNKKNTSKTDADTSKNEANLSKNNTETSIYKQDTVNQSNTNTGNHYDVTPEDTIRFYDFGEDTDTNNNEGDELAEITEIYTFSKEVKPEVMTLDLSGVGSDVLDLIEKRNNKPLVVFIQRNTDQNEYIFL